LTPDKLAAAIAMRNDPAMTMNQIAKTLQVSRSALYRRLGRAVKHEQVQEAA
jgi:AcrR family transcriptional regulator